MGRIIVGFWDCTQCGTKGILGTEQSCPNCGRQRGSDVQFYMDRNRMQTVDEVTSAAEAARHKRRGADWVCEYCNSLNRSDATNCEACGSARSEAKDDYHSQRRKQNAQNQAPPDTYNDTPPSPPPESTEADYAVPRRKGAGLRAAVQCVLALGLIAALVFGLVRCFAPRDAVMTVTGISWNYSIDIEEYRTITEEDWTVPYDGRVVSVSSRLYGYDQVLDHYDTRTETYEEIVGYEEVLVGYDYKDLGNGMFEEVPQYEQKPIYETRTRVVEEPVYVEVPIYEDWYVYEVDRWVFDFDIPASGTTHDTYWGEVPALDEWHRQGATHKRYYVTANEEGKNSNTYETSEHDWFLIEPGSTINCTVTVNNYLSLRQAG